MSRHKILLLIKPSMPDMEAQFMAECECADNEGVIIPGWLMSSDAVATVNEETPDLWLSLYVPPEMAAYSRYVEIRACNKSGTAPLLAVHISEALRHADLEARIADVDSPAMQAVDSTGVHIVFPMATWYQIGAVRSGLAMRSIMQGVKSWLGK